MTKVTWTHPFLAKILTWIPEKLDSLIDLGCGRGIIGALVRIYRNPKRLVGVDTFPNYLDFCRKYGWYDEIYSYDLRNLPFPLSDKEFEVATCVEVIEHLPKCCGENLLNELERLANLIIITTPNCFFPQENYDKNPFQRHLSRWTASDFGKRGYTVEGFGEFRVLNKKLKYFSSFLSPLCTKTLPQFSTFLLVRKDLRARRKPKKDTASKYWK